MQFKGIIEGHPPDVDLHGREVIIHDDVLIASNAVILPGVTIGEGAVIGAGSVVTKDVPPHTLAAGNPACVVRQLQAPPADHGV